VTLRRLALVVVLVAAMTAPAQAGSTIVAFRSPSGTIGCMYFREDGGSPSLRCDLRDVDDPPKRPASCRFDYGHAFELRALGRGRRLCVSDTTLDPTAKVLPYGKTRRIGPFTCTSRRTGLRCTTRAGHGFELSRERQRLF
jgi:hypothetical protein